MELLYKNGFPTPKPIDSNRHGIVMSLIDAYPLSQVKELENPKPIFDTCMNLIVKFAEYGLIHSDFNEFNLMLDENRKITVIDFPQMVSTKHFNADYYFQRDVDCILVYFEKKFNVVAKAVPKLSEIEVKHHLDVEMQASGFVKKELKNKVKELDILDEYNNQVRELNKDFKEDATSDIDEEIDNDVGDEKEEDDDEEEGEAIDENQIGTKDGSISDDESEDEITDEIFDDDKDIRYKDQIFKEEASKSESANQSEESPRAKIAKLQNGLNKMGFASETDLKEERKEGKKVKFDETLEEVDDESFEENTTLSEKVGKNKDTEKTAPKQKKKEKTAKDTNEYINEVLKKKLKFHRKQPRRNMNQNKKEKVTNIDYIF